MENVFGIDISCLELKQQQQKFRKWHKIYEKKNEVIKQNA